MFCKITAVHVMKKHQIDISRHPILYICIRAQTRMAPPPRMESVPNS